MNSISRVEKFLFYIFVFSIPFQTRLVLAHWTIPFNEWTAGFLWGTDILLGALLVCWLVRAIRERCEPRFDRADYAILTFFVIGAVSILVSRIPAVSWFRLFKLGEFMLLYFYLESNKAYFFNLETFYKIIIASGLVQAVIGILQSLVQSSLGLKVLGESVLHVGSQGVAVFDLPAQAGVQASLFLRAYGTTPHPNILATWLFIALWSFYVWYVQRASSKRDPILWGVYAILLWGFLLTFSRSPIAVWGLTVCIGFLVMMLRKPVGEIGIRMKKRVLGLFGVTAVVGLLFVGAYFPQTWSRLTISGNDEAVYQRTFYNSIAKDITRQHPFIGIGIGQFVPELMHRLRIYPAYIYQPAHNLYYLITTEMGILGFIAFLGFIILRIYSMIRVWRTRWPLLLVFGGLLLMGFFDHYFWTLQQGGLMFWGVLGLL